MTPLFNSLACLMALALAFFLWRGRIFLLKEGLLILGFLLVSCVFTLLAGDPLDPSIEHYPFKMLALCLCFSTTRLQRKRRRYLVLAQALWLWVELFGAVALSYRGVDVSWIRVLDIFLGGVCCCFLSKVSKEMEFCLMVFWIAIWILF